MRDISYGLSTAFLFLGYGLVFLGITSNAWKFESGYRYGLWFRCDDKRGCSFHEVDFTDLITVLRGAIAVTALIFTIGVLCLCLELCLKMTTKGQSVHLRRNGRVVDVTVFMAEIILTLILAYYGHRTIRDRQKLPHLLWGYAVTGVGTIISIMGSILRTMGPVYTWNRLPCIRKSKEKPRNATAVQSDQGPSAAAKTPRKRAERSTKPSKKEKRYVRCEGQKKDIIVLRKPSQFNRVLPYLAPGVLREGDSYESIESNPEISPKSTFHRYEVPQLNEPVFLRTDHSQLMANTRGTFPARRPGNLYQISAGRSPGMATFHTLPAPPKADPLADTVVVQSDSSSSFEELPSTSRHTFVYDWP